MAQNVVSLELTMTLGVFVNDDNQKNDDKITPITEEGVPLNTEQRTKKLLTVVCICKGINLGKVLKGIEGCQTVEDVNQKTGCGSGGCKGQRCGPRIKILLQKIKAKKEKPTV